MTFANKLRDIMKVDLKEETTYNDVKASFTDLLHRVGTDSEAGKKAKKIWVNYKKGNVKPEEAEDQFTDLAYDAIKAEINAPKDTKSTGNSFALEANTDFDGNPIPDEYKPVYVIKYGPNDYDFTNDANAAVMFNKDNEQEILAELQQNRPALQVEPNYDIETTAASSEPEEIPTDSIAKPKGTDVAKNKKKYSDIIMPDSKIMHNSTYVDSREIEAYAKNGIHPNIAYADAPKPGWWYKGDDGKKHMIKLYGISSDSLAGESQVFVREVLPPKLLKDGYLKYMEGNTFMMPVEQFKEIMTNEYNKDTYEYLMTDKYGDQILDDPEGWVEDIKIQTAKMKAQYEDWKQQNTFKYNLDQYTEDSLLKVYYANVGKHYPMQKALELYGQTTSDVQNTKADRLFNDWYTKNVDKYNLDRFDQETLRDIFTDVKVNDMSMEDAILQNGNLDYNMSDEDDDYDVEESVLSEAPTSDFLRTSKDDIITDKNLLRNIVLPNLGINPIYIGNPIRQEYSSINANGDPSDLDKTDEAYLIKGVQKPYAGAKPEDISPTDMPLIQVSNISGPRAKTELLPFAKVRRMLSASKLPEVGSQLSQDWLEKRYPDWRSQRRPLNPGAGYKYMNLPEEVVLEILNQQENKPNYSGTDLIDRYNTAKRTHKEDKFVSRAIRAFDPSVSIRVNKPGDFIGYLYAKSSTSKLPTRVNSFGGQNPYKFLMNF